MFWQPLRIGRLAEFERVFPQNEHGRPGGFHPLQANRLKITWLPIQGCGWFQAQCPELLGNIAGRNPVAEFARLAALQLIRCQKTGVPFYFGAVSFKFGQSNCRAGSLSGALVAGRGCACANVVTSTKYLSINKVLNSWKYGTIPFFSKISLVNIDFSKVFC